MSEYEKITIVSIYKSSINYLHNVKKDNINHCLDEMKKNIVITFLTLSNIRFYAKTLIFKSLDKLTSNINNYQFNINCIYTFNKNKIDIDAEIDEIMKKL